MRLIARHPRIAGPYGLGQVVVPPRPVVFTRAMLVERRLTAMGLIFGGLTTAASLLLFATGNDKAGYMLGVTSALWGATIGAIRVFSAEENVNGS